MPKKVLSIPYKLGDKGLKIQEAQKLLQKFGSKIIANGEFGIGMMSAVKSFQRKNGLEPTGVIDQITWEKLNEKKARRKKA